MNKLKKIIKFGFYNPNFLHEVKFAFFKKIYNVNKLYLSGFTPFLRQLTLIPTHLCNQKCKFCPHWEYSKLFEIHYGEPFLSDFKYFTKTIEEVSFYKPNITLTGGEPLLHPHWDKLAYSCKSKNLYLHLQTNGSLIKENIEKIIEFVDEISLPLESHKKEIYNDIRGDDNAFDMVLSGIKAIDETKKLLNKKKPLINIWYVINEKNYKEIEEFTEAISQLNVEINNLVFRHFTFTDEEMLKKHNEEFARRFNINAKFWAEYLYLYKPKLDLESLIKTIKKILLKKYSFNIEFFPNLSAEEIRNYYITPSYLPQRFKKCFYPFFNATLQPNGDVWICPNYCIGNVKENSFLSLWNNSKAKTIRINLLKNGILPNCRGCIFYGVWI